MTATSPIVDLQTPQSEAYRDALRFLYDRINYERWAGSGTTRYPFRLQRVSELIHGLNLHRYLYDQDRSPSVPLIHIAGTKGKGSVAAMVAAALTASGLRTGLYTSPHLHRLEERFRIDGDPCSPDELVALVQRIAPVTQQVEQSSGGMSFFELTTAMALMHFDTSRCDALVIEVGLGGRLDSTNVLAPSLSVVTSIGLDHQHVLGHDLPSIAREKAGIIKRGIPVVSGVTVVEAAEVIEARARECGSTLYWLGRDFSYRSNPRADWGSDVHFEGFIPPFSPRAFLTVAMEGEHQARNAAVALAAIDVLRHQRSDSTMATPISNHPIPACSNRFELPPAAIESAISRLQCEARIEHKMLDQDVLAIVDASHNDDSIRALCRCLRLRSANRPITVVFGTSLDKDAEPMLQSLAEVADRMILTRYHGNPRFRPPSELARLIPDSLRQRFDVVEDSQEACREGLRKATPGGTLVVCGSFFLAGETRQWILQQRITAGHP